MAAELDVVVAALARDEALKAALGRGVEGQGLVHGQGQGQGRVRRGEQIKGPRDGNRKTQ